MLHHSGFLSNKPEYENVVFVFLTPKFRFAEENKCPKHGEKYRKMRSKPNNLFYKSKFVRVV